MISQIAINLVCLGTVAHLAEPHVDEDQVPLLLAIHLLHGF